MKRKAIVAMSGGVDSSVAAALMKADGWDVTGIFMKLWKGPAANNESGCCSVGAAEDARRVAQILDIPFFVFNMADHFSQTVIARFTAGYAAGTTPNPCVECNRSVKFAALLERARVFGASALATGHYARVTGDEGSKRLLKGLDHSKDQSYVLYMLDQEELSMARFPVGSYTKSEIRAVARELGLRTADKPESQEICFVPSGDSHAFLADALPEGSRPGPILTTSGEVVGEHRGFAHYTVGQRKGLGVGFGFPVYVRSVSPERNSVVVATRDEMRIDEIRVEGVSMVSGEMPDEFRSSVMTRYRGPLAPAMMVREGTGYLVTFDDMQLAPAPGQAAVFYRDDEVLGGGTICLP